MAKWVAPSDFLNSGSAPSMLWPDLTTRSSAGQRDGSYSRRDMSVRGPQRLGLANQHEERSRCSSSLQLARRVLANVPPTAHTAAALQLKKAALDHHIARVSGPDAPLSLAPQCSQFARP